MSCFSEYNVASNYFFSWSLRNSFAFENMRRWNLSCDGEGYILNANNKQTFDRVETDTMYILNLFYKKKKLNTKNGPVKQLSILKVKFERFSHSFTKLGI